LASSLPFFLVTAFCSAQDSKSRDSFKDTVAYLIAKADKGHADSKGLVALLYSVGVVDNKLVSEAQILAFTKESAEKQSVFGKLQVAREQKRVNPNGAVKLFRELVPQLRRSAEGGDPNCQDFLGDCFLAGDGVEQDLSEAVRWYKTSAQQGLPWAQNDLAECFEFGRGVQQDRSEAVRWYRMSASQGYPIAQRKLGEYYYAGTGVEKDISSAVRWLQKAADQGETASLLFLARLYQNGDGVPEDSKRAVSLVTEAATRGNAQAQMLLGDRYRNGIGVQRSDSEAMKWYMKAAEPEGRLNDQDARTVESKISDLNPEEGNRRLQKKVEKAAKQLEDLAKQVAARALDEQSGKFGGPSTEQIMLAIGGGAFGDSKVTVKRGEVLVSNGGKAPVGTKLFPVRVSGQVNGLDVSFTFRFWKDEFGDWQAEHVQK
jgi:TPR repeat protein